MGSSRREHIAALAASDFARHELHEDGPGHWRCQAPGSWVMGFHVITAPHLVVAGDIGDVILQVSDRDATAWARRVRDPAYPDYACGKIIASPEGRHPRAACDVKVAAAMADVDRDEEQRAEWRRHLDSIGIEPDGEPDAEEFVRWAEDLGPDGFDIDDWTSSALWAFHALTWWARAMDAAEVARG